MLISLCKDCSERVCSLLHGRPPGQVTGSACGLRVIYAAEGAFSGGHEEGLATMTCSLLTSTCKLGKE